VKVLDFEVTRRLVNFQKHIIVRMVSVNVCNDVENFLQSNK